MYFADNKIRSLHTYQFLGADSDLFGAGRIDAKALHQSEDLLVDGSGVRGGVGGREGEGGRHLRLHPWVGLHLDRVCYIPLQTERRGMDIPSTFSEAQPRRMYEEYPMPL